MLQNFSKDKFLCSVKTIEFWRIYQCDDVDKALQILTDNLTEILDMLAPLKTIQIREKYAPWLTKETQAKMVERNEAQKQASRSGLVADWNNFKRLRNEINACLRTEKKSWQSNKFSSVEKSRDSGRIWKAVKNSLNWSASGAPTKLFYGGRLLTKPIDLAETMNRYFTDKITQIT